MTSLEKEKYKPLWDAIAPSPWLQRAIDRMSSMSPYPSKEERRKILDEEKAKGN